MKILLTSILCLFVVSCMSIEVAKSRVSFVESGLVHDNNAYEIKFSKASKLQFINSDWIIDNWYLEKGEAKTPQRRIGPKHKGVVYMDLSGNGVLSEEKTYFYDLELKNRKTSGSIWVNSFGLPSRMNKTLLDVFLQNYAESISGSDFWLSRGVIGKRPAQETKTYATQVVEKRNISFGPYKALIATISIANIDQLRMDPNHRHGTIRIMIMRIRGPYEHKTKSVVQGVTIHRKTKHENGFLVIGYFNSPAYYETNLQDYYRFLGQFRFNGKRAIDPEVLKNETGSPSTAVPVSGEEEDTEHPGGWHAEETVTDGGFENSP